MRRKTLVLFMLLTFVEMCFAQHPMGTEQRPASLSIEWMLIHPMGYLRYNDYVSMAKIVALSHSDKASLWDNFELNEKDLSMSADLIEKFSIPMVGAIDDIFVTAHFSESGSYIKSWGYTLFFKNKSTGKRCRAQIIHELKKYGYWKEDDGVYHTSQFVTGTKGFPSSVYVSNADESLSLLFN
ncbi:MAG: hypothetical protein IJ710_02680 [Prevotella sp.]|nr:hypothetical protein [Prevotella sp.]